MYYLGKYGSDASRQEYDRVIAEFIANGRQPFYDPTELPIKSLILRFLDYAEKNLNHTATTRGKVVLVLRLLDEMYGEQPVSQFNPTALKTLRQRFIDQKLARSTINNYIRVITQVFCWGCEEEIVPAEIGAALRMVKHLQAGRTTAADYAAIEPVADEIVEKTLPHLTPVVQDMVRGQRLISGRPQDVYNMRFCDIDMSGEVWKYTPFTHKTKKRGKIRVLHLGPRSQQILKAYVDRCTDTSQFIFISPRGNQYSSATYGIAITRACAKAGVAKWSPNQLRHAGGTEVRSKFGLDYAQAVLGHSSAKITEIYAKIDCEKAAKVAKEIG
jgi:integrase